MHLPHFKIRFPIRRQKRFVKVTMTFRPDFVPLFWRVVDYGGEDREGRVYPAPSFHDMEMLRLVLCAKNIPHIITGDGANTRAYVPAIYEKTARRELEEFINERPDDPPLPSVSRSNMHYSIVIVLALIAWFGFYSGWWKIPFVINEGADYWVHIGKLDTGLVLKGEWWRVCTALTLHADSHHLFSNALIGTPFILVLGQRIGTAPMIFGIVLSGCLGNALDVWYRGAGYASLGFSTALFAIIGMLCADVITHYRVLRFRNIALPMAAGMALLALLGSEGEHTDYAAHVFGLISGFVVGLTMGYFSSRYPYSHKIELLLGIVALSFCVFCWALACSH